MYNDRIRVSYTLPRSPINRSKYCRLNSSRKTISIQGYRADGIKVRFVGEITNVVTHAEYSDGISARCP